MDLQHIIKQEIKIDLNYLEVFKVLGFGHTDFLILFMFLGFLDGANCLTITEKEIAQKLYINPRTVARAMVRLKDVGVIKSGNRYDFTYFLKNIEESKVELDNSTRK
jgi:hypothetical protein